MKHNIEAWYLSRNKLYKRRVRGETLDIVKRMLVTLNVLVGRYERDI
jgi:hypothetical protein